MGYHPRIECSKVASFQTTRTRASELWFVNNRELELQILGNAAKCSKRYEITLYAFSVEGNHIQFPALFPKANRAHFMRDFNSAVARVVPRLQSKHPGGPFWARRYSAEYLPGAEDIEEQFFYTVLQPVQDGLVDDIREYPGYNCFEDAIRGTVRSFKVVKWKEYNDAKRWCPTVSIEAFTEYHELRYERLPGYEGLKAAEYEEVMRAKLKTRTLELLKRRDGRRGVGVHALRRVKPGARPFSTKTSTRTTHRPRILSKDDRRRASGKAWYFSIYFKYQRASKRYRLGKRNVEFPPGTYIPPAFTVINKDVIT